MSFDSFFATITSSKAVVVDNTDPSLFPAGEVNYAKSQTYQWKGPEISVSVGGPLPIIYGRHKVSGNIINAYVETGDVDTLNMLIALCEGPVNGVSNVKINGTPIEQLYGVEANDPYGANAEVTFRKGEVNQSAIQEFGDIHSTNETNHELLQNVEYIYTANLDNAQAFNLEISANELYQLDENNNKISWYFGVKIEYRVQGETNWTFGGLQEINALSETIVRRFFKTIYLPPARYEIRVTKTSENESDTRFGKVTLASIDEIINLKLQYPFVSLLGVRLVATQKMSSETPNVTAEVEGRTIRIPDVRYGGDPIEWDDYYWDVLTQQFRTLAGDNACTWDGETYIEAFSANPAWCLRDLITNSRYGLGQFSPESSIDEASFLAAAKFCDEGVVNVYGKIEKRCRLDIVVDVDTPAPALMNQIAATFRGLIAPSTNGQLKLIIEGKSAYKQIFNVGNIIRDSFNMAYHSAKEIPNVLVFQYTNKDKDYAADTIEISDEEAIQIGLPIRTERVDFYGCTRPSQLIREGKTLLKKLKLNTRSISFEAFTDSLLCETGDVILFQHDTPQWSFGGRVKTASTASIIKLDRSVTIESGKSYKISVRSNVDDTIQERTISNTAGVYSQLNLSTPLTFTPQAYDLWVFGETSNFAMQYRITGITRRADGITSLSAVQYNETAYDETSPILPDDNFSYISLDVPHVTSLAAKEQVTRENDGTIRDVILVTFARPPMSLRWLKRAIRFHVYYSDNGGKNWQYAGDTDTEEYTISKPLAIGKTYTVAVVTETEGGEKSQPSNSPQESLTIWGWQERPPTVTGFYYSFTDVIQLYWNKVVDRDLAGYEVRTENQDWGQDDAGLVWRGSAEKYTVAKPSGRSGVTYYIKAFNTSLKYANQAAAIFPINLAPDAPALTYSGLFQKAFLMWNDVYDTDIKHYEVWRNDNDNWIGIPQGNEELVGEITGTSSVQIIPYNTTFFRIRAVDAFGGGAWSNTVQCENIQIMSQDIANAAVSGIHIQAASIVAAHIQTAQIQAEHIAVKAVLAQSIDVADLSAISANLGTMTAGTIIGATIKTADQPYRVEINSGGLFAYDSDGKLRTKLTRGELCLVDPLNSDFYSYLDAGSLKFHHPYGTTPYVKRIASGEATTGGTVFLQQWYERPEVTVSVQRLSSFKATSIESDQEWRVYHDNVRSYDNGGGDFGWAFDVHSKLVISGGQRPECVWLCNFDQSVTTVNNTKEALVKSAFQLYTHGIAPSKYCYGVENYEVRYKIHGSGVWCVCEYTYTQPNSTADWIQCTQIMCNTIIFPESNQWDISVHRTSLDWYETQIDSGFTCCCWCIFQYTVDCSYFYYSYFNSTVTGPNTGSIWVVKNQAPPYSRSATVNFGSPPSGEIVSSTVSFRVDGYTNGSSSHISWTGGGVGGGAAYHGNVQLSGGGFISSISATASISSGSFINDNAAVCLSQIQNALSLRCCCKCCLLYCCWCCYQYPYYEGAPETVTYEKLYSTQDITDAEISLDDEGTVNYLAMSYS